MGMFDNVVVLDESLRCPHGHRVEGFQTKSFADPTMDTYLVEGPRVYFVVRSGLDDSNDAEAAHWLLESNEAVFRRRHAVEPIVSPREIIFYTACDECTPVLVRCDRPRTWGDLIEERQLGSSSEQRSIRKASGTSNGRRVRGMTF